MAEKQGAGKESGGAERPKLPDADTGSSGAGHSTIRKAPDTGTLTTKEVKHAEIEKR